jgi:nitronate monooxygenase
VVREERVAILSFAFGLPDAATLAALKGDGTLLIGTATTVPEAVALEAAGIDLVVAQGSEAGGHRGTFLDPFEAAMIGTLALTPQLADAVDIPVIAAGGIMDGRGIVAALALGAAGAQLGTAFLAGPESAAPPAHKAALLSGTVETVVTRAFSGKPVRAIRNRLVDELAAHEAELPPYPIQNGLTRDIRQAATRQGRPEYMGMWAGQAAALSRDLPAGELVATLVREVEATLGRLGS